MERIRLSATEKNVLRLLNQHGNKSLDTIAHSQVYRALNSLEQKNLIKIAWLEGGDYEAIEISRNGKSYLIENPKLRNPIDWSKTGAIAGIIAALASIIVLFVACTKITLI